MSEMTYARKWKLLNEMRTGIPTGAALFAAILWFNGQLQLLLNNWGFCLLAFAFLFSIPYALAWWLKVDLSKKPPELMANSK